MLDVLDYDLQKTEPEPPHQRATPGRPRAAWIVTGVVVLVIALAVYLRLTSPATEAGTTATTAPVTAYRAAEPAAPALAAPISLPPLDLSDDAVRRLIAALSSHPRIAAWLATPNLIRTMAVVVENIGSGLSPSRHLRVLRPAGPFGVIATGETLRLDPRNYTRFDGIGDAAASIDATGAATLYAGLRPRLDEAYRELGRQDSFDAVLERAIVALLQVPVPGNSVPLVPGRGALYNYADTSVRELTSAQQQLYRMGPRNVRLIQAKLQEFRSAALP